MKVRVKQEGPRVHVAIDDRAFLDIGPKEALELAALLRQVAKRAEEHEKADRIIYDSAILLRAGSNFALSNHAAIIDRAKLEAAHNRDLRRYMPGIKSAEAFGLPTIRRGAPKQ